MNKHIYKINNRFYLLLGVVFYVLLGGMYSRINAQSTRLTFSIASQNPSITNQPIDNFICQNANANFSVAATSFTGSQPLTYQWQVSTNGGSSYSNITNNTTYSGATTSSLNITNTAISFNSYKYRVIVTNTCNFTVTSNSANLIVNVPPIISGPTAACVGNAITLTGSGTPNASLPWVSSNTSVATVNSSGLVAALSAGNTTINYIDNNGCSTNSTITISSSPILTAPTSSAICSGSSTNLSVSCTQHCPGLTYNWAPSTGLSSTTTQNVTATPSSSTLYTVTVTNANGCSTASVYTVTVNPTTSITSQSTASQTVCLNGSFSQLSVNANGDNLTYQWYSIEYPTGSVFCNGPTDIIDVTNPVTGKTWMDRNLGASRTAQSNTDSLAYGDLYQWGRGSDGHQCRNSSTTSTLSSTDQPGHGDFIISNSDPFDWRNPQNDNLWQGVNGINNPCPSGYRLPTETELNNERLSWVQSPVSSSNNSDGAFNSFLKLPLSGYRDRNNGAIYFEGSYGFYWSSATSTSSALNLEFLNSDAFIISYIRATGFSIRCIKESTSGNSINGATGSTYTPSSSTVGTSYYYVIVSGTCGADTSLNSGAISVNPNPTVSLLPNNALCNGASTGSINNTNSGGTSFTYNWQESNFNTISTNQNLENVPTGTYSVQVTNNFGCSATATETITEPPFLNLSVSGVNNPQCAGDSSGTISVIATGGTAPYQFSLIGGVYSSSATFTGLTSGNYTITAKDINNCMINSSVTLVDSSIINPIFPSTFSICSGSSFNLPTTSSNGITGTWNPPINNQVTTTYTFTPNAGQCSNTATTIVIVNQVNLMASASITDCGNSQGFIRVDSVIGAVGPFTYQLNNGTPQFNNPNFSGLQAGNYIVYATDANACVASANMNISSVQPLSINLSGNNLTCGPFTNASLNASVNGGSPPYQYNWLTTGNTDSIFNITSSGTYTLVVYDLYSCSVTQTLTVIEPTPLTANITTQTNISCNGLDNGSATVNANGGTSPYTYSWNTNPVQTGSVAINLFAGNYQVTIKDTNNCLVTINVDITQPSSFTASPTMISNIGCNGPALGSASVEGVGGVPPYFYSWSTVPAITTDTAFNLSSGNYTISVYDSNNCTATVPITITQSSAPNAITTSTDINCNGILNGTASVSVNGGTAPFTYEWNTTPAQTIPTINNLAVGNYMVIVRDSMNCRDTAFVTITEPQALVVSITKTDITCFGLNNGSAIANANGGIAPYTFLWSNTQSSGSLFGLSSGNFTLDVTDANGCIVTNNISILEPQLLEVSIVTQTNVVGVGVNNGTATASVNGGTTPYTFNWSHNPATNTNFVNDLPAGTHIVTVIDNNNCSDTATVIIITEQNYLLSENIITKTNVPFTLNIFTNDIGFSNLITDTLPILNASHGTISIQQNGDLVYIPNVNFSGYDKVIVKACTPLLQICLLDTIYITVKPNAQIDFSTTNGFANAVVATGNVLANDAGSGIQQSAQLISTVSNGTVTLDANGNFLYRPTRNYCGLDSFNYQICDTNNLCAIASCIFEVICRDIIVFTGFSPNGDGINDNWVIADIEGTINTVSIFDRWGRLVNSYKNYDNVTIVWDGTNSSGNQLISGTYFYAIEIENKPRRLGWIEITR